VVVDDDSMERDEEIFSFESDRTPKRKTVHPFNEIERLKDIRIAALL
jgi:hypothetical protein